MALPAVLAGSTVCAIWVSAAATCGDGVTIGGEICDGQDFGGKTCMDFGYYAPESLAHQHVLRGTGRLR